MKILLKYTNRNTLTYMTITWYTTTTVTYIGQATIKLVAGDN